MYNSYVDTSPKVFSLNKSIVVPLHDQSQGAIPVGINHEYSINNDLRQTERDSI